MTYNIIFIILSIGFAFILVKLFGNTKQRNTEVNNNQISTKPTSKTSYSRKIFSPVIHPTVDDFSPDKIPESSSSSYNYSSPSCNISSFYDDSSYDSSSSYSSWSSDSGSSSDGGGGCD